MRNDSAAALKYAGSMLAKGLLETAVQREAGKGCSAILCTDPVGLEPPYAVFDAARIITGDTTEYEPGVLGPFSDSWVTLNVYASPEDELSIDWVSSLFAALAGFGVPFSFELFGGAGAVVVRFGVPSSSCSFFTQTLLWLFPGVRLAPEATPFPSGMPRVVAELVPVAPYHRTLSLLGREGASPLGILSTAIARLPAGDVGLYQVLLQPAASSHDWHYNVTNLVEAEMKARGLSYLGGLSSVFRYDGVLPALLEPSAVEKVRRDVAFYAVLVRVAAWTASPAEGLGLVGALSALGSMVRFGNRSWRVLSHERLVGALGAAGVDRLVRARSSHRPGVMVTSAEAASLAHLPNARTLLMLAHLGQRRGLEWTGPTTGDVGSAILGTNEYAGTRRFVVLALSRRLQHLEVVGSTGCGKSHLFENLFLADAHAGLGVGLIDPHGDLCLRVLARLPEERLSDLVYVSFSEEGFVPRWNPFRTTGSSGKFADDLTRAFAAATTTFGARMEHVLRLTSYVTHQLGGTLEDLAELVGKTTRGEHLRQEGLRRIKVPEVQRFLGQELPAYRAADLDSVRNKLSRLLLDEALGSTFRQSANDLDPRTWLDAGRIVLVNLSAARVGTDHARIAAGLLLSLIHRAATSRADQHANERRAFMLYVDECQQVQTGTLEESLAEGRKYGLGLVLAHQVLAVSKN